MRKSTTILLTLFSLALVSLPSLAAWKLDNENSRLNFVSVKKASIAENHSFKKLEGSIDNNGKVNIKVDLTSVDTNIAIRDERLKKFVFESDKYTSQLCLVLSLIISMLATLEVGDSRVRQVSLVP